MSENLEQRHTLMYLNTTKSERHDYRGMSDRLAMLINFSVVIAAAFAIYFFVR